MKQTDLKVLTICAAFLFFFSCQSGENETARNEKKTLTPVSIQLQWVTQSQFAGYYTALEKGFYKDEGLDVTIYPGGPDIVPIDFVTGGTRDFGTTLLADLVVSIGRGKPAVSIAQIQQDNGLRLLAKKTSGILGPKDFIGKRVGVWLGGWEVQFNALLAQEQIDPQNIQVVSQGFSMNPFLEGRIDVASAMIYNEYYMVLSAGISPGDLVVIDYADYHLDFPGDTFFTSKKMVREKPEICLKTLRASIRGWQYAMAHVDEAVNIILKHDTSGVAAFDHQKKMMLQVSKLIKGSGDQKLGAMDPAAFSRMIDLLVKNKMLGSALSPKETYTTQFIDRISD